jgi:hypothetical protein
LYGNFFAVQERSTEEGAPAETSAPDEVDPSLDEVEERLCLNADRRFVQMLLNLNNPEITAVILEAYQIYCEDNDISRLPPTELMVPAIMRLFDVAQEAIRPEELDDVYDKTKAWEFMGCLEDLIEANAPPEADESTR